MIDIGKIRSDLVGTEKKVQDIMNYFLPLKIFYKSYKLDKLTFQHNNIEVTVNGEFTYIYEPDSADKINEILNNSMFEISSIGIKDTLTQ